MRPYDYPWLSDEEWRALKRTEDRTTAYELGVYAAMLAIGLICLLGACGLLDWVVAL